MSKSIDLNSIAGLIAEALKEHEDLRDDDLALIAYVWRKEAMKCNVKKLQDFLYYLKAGVFTHPESIRRNRQLVQQHYEILRGKYFGKRKPYEKKVVDQLHYVTNFPPKEINGQIGIGL